VGLTALTLVVDGKVTVHAIGADGRLSDKPVQSIPTADKAHAIVPDPSNRFVFVPHTGANAIFQFTFDATTGGLTPNNPSESGDAEERRAAPLDVPSVQAHRLRRQRAGQQRHRV
jgi:6-phosphogluconolactonase (cycloisomerase 2 family)